MTELSKTSQDFRENLLQQINKPPDTQKDNTLLRCKKCGREDKFCQNCEVVSKHYRMFDGDHNELKFEDGKWKIYMFGKPLCIIRPIHIKVILDSVKIQDRKDLLDNNQLDMFLHTLIDDISIVINKIAENPNLERLNDHIRIRSLRNSLNLVKEELADFEKINMIMDKGRIEII